MNHYHIWCNLKPGISDVEFCERVQSYLGNLAEKGLIQSFQVTRRMLGFGPAELGDFHIAIQVNDLAQLESAFTSVSKRNEPIESLHAAVNQFAADSRFALYRDFPDPHRVTGEEKF